MTEYGLPPGMMTTTVVAIGGVSPGNPPKLTAEAEKLITPPDDLTPGSWPYCVARNRTGVHPLTLARQHFGVHRIELDAGGDVPLAGRALAVVACDCEGTCWCDAPFSGDVLLVTGAVLSLPYEFVNAGHVWVMDHGGRCGCGDE